MGVQGPLVAAAGAAGMVQGGKECCKAVKVEVQDPLVAPYGRWTLGGRRLGNRAELAAGSCASEQSALDRAGWIRLCRDRTGGRPCGSGATAEPVVQPVHLLQRRSLRTQGCSPCVRGQLRDLGQHVAEDVRGRRHHQHAAVEALRVAHGRAEAGAAEGLVHVARHHRVRVQKDHCAPGSRKDGSAGTSLNSSSRFGSPACSTCGFPVGPTLLSRRPWPKRSAFHTPERHSNSPHKLLGLQQQRLKCVAGLSSTQWVPPVILQGLSAEASTVVALPSAAERRWKNGTFAVLGHVEDGELCVDGPEARRKSRPLRRARLPHAWRDGRHLTQLGTAPGGPTRGEQNHE